MPRFDGTGPAGMGPMTGGGRGWCNPYGARTTGYGPYRRPYPVPGRGLGRWFWARGRGRALGRGWDRGRGRGWWV